MNTLKIPHHVSFTPNGNRRGARARGITYDESYQLGAERALLLAQHARERNIKHVTFFGLSCENIARRSREEIDALTQAAIAFCDAAIKDGVHVHAFGKLYEFADDPRYAYLYERLRALEATAYGLDDFVIHVAANYSGEAQHELAPLIQNIQRKGIDEVAKNPMEHLLSGGVPKVDLAIRTGGEQRTSGLLPFQMAYAELYFTPKLWADFDENSFNEALDWFAHQPRNFGK